MFPIMIRSFRRFSYVNRHFSVGRDPGGVNIDDPDEIENMETNYNDIYLQLHKQSNAVARSKIEDIVRPKEYRTIGEYAETVQQSLSQHIKSNPCPDPETSRTPRSEDATVATAVGRIYLGRDTMEGLEQDKVLTSLKTVAQVAGILAAKRTGELIPHNYSSSSLDKVDISVTLEPESSQVLITSTVHSRDGDGQTEAVLACSVALVTIFDHFKYQTSHQLCMGNISLQ